MFVVIVSKSYDVLSTAVTEDSGMTAWETWAEAAAVCVALGIATTAITLCIKILRVRRRNAELNPDIVPRPDGESPI